MELLICFGILLLTMALLFLSDCHTLRAINEDAAHAMGQIGTQLSARADAVLALLALAQGYAGDSMAALAEQVQLRRRIIDSGSAPEAARQQEKLLDDTMAAVAATAACYPGLREDEAYSRLFGTSDCCEQMLGTSRLLYNDAVTRLDREMRRFPASLAARVCGIEPRAHWEA